MVRPTGGYRACSHGIFERKVPADDPGKNFAEGRIRVGISTARERNHSREFRVAECGKSATQAGENKGKHQARPGIVSAQPGEDEDSGSYHCANAEGGQLENAKRTLQAVRAGIARFLQQLVQRLFRKKVRHAFASLL